MLEIRARHSLVKVGEFVENFLRGFVFVVVFDDFKVEFAAEELHLDIGALLDYNVL